MVERRTEALPLTSVVSVESDGAAVFRRPDGHWITVRWRSNDGFGVQFDGMAARDVWAFGKYFEQLS